MLQVILSPLAILLSLCTSTGILLHDTKVDKMAALAILAPVSANRYAPEDNAGKLETTAHTHVEHTSIDQISSELGNQNPTTTPRKEDKKYRLQKKVARGFYTFDTYNLPIGLANNSQLSF